MHSHRFHQHPHHGPHWERPSAGFTRQDRQVNIRDHGDNVELTIDVPGIKASNLNVAVEDRVLTISGTRDDSSFSRQFQLDKTVDIEHLKANLADGVLTITAAKVQEPAPINITITEEPSLEASKETMETEEGITVETVAGEDDAAEAEVVMVEAPESDAATTKA